MTNRHGKRSQDQNKQSRVRRSQKFQPQNSNSRANSRPSLPLQTHKNNCVPLLSSNFTTIDSWGLSGAYNLWPTFYMTSGSGPIVSLLPQQYNSPVECCRQQLISCSPTLMSVDSKGMTCKQIPVMNLNVNTALECPPSTLPQQQLLQKQQQETSSESVQENKHATVEHFIPGHNIFMPEEIPGDLQSQPVSQSSSGTVIRRNLKRVTFQEDNIVSSDPVYNQDLRRSEYVSNIPATEKEMEALQDLETRLQKAMLLWDATAPQDHQLETLLSKFGQLDEGVQSGSFEDFLFQGEYLTKGTYPGLFSLPLLSELKRRHADKVMRTNVQQVLLTMEQEVATGVSSNSINSSSSDADVDEVTPPLSLIHWGLLQDPKASKRRQREKQQEEQQDPNHLETASRRRRPQSRRGAPGSVENHPLSAASQVTPSGQPKRAIVKTSHMLDPPGTFITSSPRYEERNSSGFASFSSTSSYSTTANSFLSFGTHSSGNLDHFGSP